MRRLLLATSLGLAASLSVASAPARAQTAKPIPGFKTELITNTDSGAFINIFAIHMLSGGSILAVDASMRRMLVVDSSLKKFTVVADTAGNAAQTYGNSQGGLISYVGDSAAFVDQYSKGLITIDRNGKFGHVSSMPNVNDIVYLGGPAYGKPGFDVKGRLFYRSVLRMTGPPKYGPDSSYMPPDTAPILRADLDARRTDTVGWVHVLTYRQRPFASAPGFTTNAQYVNPLPVIDDWAYDRDGTVAIVRGGDYHIDWILPDGSKKSTPPMAFDRKRITEIEKKQIIDSVKHVADSARAVRDSLDRARAASGRGGGDMLVGPDGQRIPFKSPPPMFVEPSELPDYIPALKANSRPRFDLDGNLWVVPATAIPLTAAGLVAGGLLYDVIDRTGTVIKRVQLPPGRILSNFGPNGIVYLVVPVTTGWTRIERVRLEPIAAGARQAP